MKFAVDPWAPEYESSSDLATLAPSDAVVDVNVEVSAQDWAPRAAAADPAKCTVFVDGVRRIDARVWIQDPDGASRLGICASYAAGVTRCDSAARVDAVAVRRALFATARPSVDGVSAIATRAGTFEPRTVASDDVTALTMGLQQRMTELEVEVAASSEPADLVVIDGPLRGSQHLDDAVGYVKTHHVAYLPAIVADSVVRLTPGERTPLFFMTTSWSRYSWYLRLPCQRTHDWAGVVRCEASGELTQAQAVALAERATATLPRFASSAYKDARAPQNLYPIAGLERELRRRLGDPALIQRMLRQAAAAAAAA